ncbi:gamma-glutamyltransferase family protein [Sphingosinicella sp. BN140058]|uniref:gamma-glutamyltransferase family protein n=1 Tax=Sphingosinicella sp. BN140058 TaxID=1892855 RepID=UPI001010F098|nr:gamma-glutamyltransferase family protein [Sphingosinicella sp. BN140058]QAY78118.1 gamma-glutamyltransferase family protein [Sphingosinicella sp. BN140058]
MRRAGKCLAFAAALLVQAAALPPSNAKDQGDRHTGAPHASRSPVLGRNGMAATSQPLATQVALDILKRGGSAADAAIAANAMLGLLEPNMCGVGGDLFAILWDPATHRLYGLEAAGRSPHGLSRDRLLRLAGKSGQIPSVGWPAVTVPGAVDGWFALHRKFGRLPMAELLAPAIGYAEAGIPITQETARFLGEDAAYFGKKARDGALPQFASYRRLYMPGGKPLVEAQVFQNPDLARTYRLLAAEGRDGFYQGRVGRALDAWFHRIGAPHRLEDLRQQASRWIEPVSIRYHGYDVFELPPPGQGMAALEMLKLLETRDLKAKGRASPDYWHALIEAKKLAYADRAAIYGDDPALPVSMLLSDAYAARRTALIDDARASVRTEAGLPPSKDTTYLAVGDKDGMMVSLIQSNASSGGSGLVPEDEDGRTLGFVLQDRGAAFTLVPGLPNSYAPGKRPFHTIMPGFVMKAGKPFLSFGVMGGDMQPQGQVQVLLNILDLGMNVQAAGDAARFLHQGSADPDGTPADPEGGTVLLESGVPGAIADELARRGHVVVRGREAFFGGYQAVLRDENGVYWGASEFRTDGQAAGY